MKRYDPTGALIDSLLFKFLKGPMRINIVGREYCSGTGTQAHLKSKALWFPSCYNLERTRALIQSNHRCSLP